MKYRDHRGGFKESMETTIEVENVGELVDHLSKIYGEIKRLKFKYQGLDERNGWETFNVEANRKGESFYFICGMSDGNFIHNTTKH